jgi:uncharacterized protein DUF3788
MTSKTHPTVESVEQALGSRSKLFAKLLATHPELKPEWKYYGKKYGWTLKLFERKRNLCFITPRDGELRVAFVFGDKQYRDVMESSVQNDVKEQLANAKRYAEGRGVSLVIRKNADLKTVEELLRIKRGATRT